MNSLFENLTEYLLGQSVHIVWLFILVGVVCLALRSKSAHLRYLLWLLIIAKCLVPSLVTISLAILPEKPAPVVEQVVYEPMARPEVFIPAATEYVPMVEVPVDTRPAFIQYITAMSKEELLAFGWMTGAGLFLVLIAAKAMHTNLILTKNRRALPELLQAEVSELLGTDTGAGPSCYCMEGIAQPFVWGLVRGSIYLPSDFMASTDGEHRRQILMHEMAHITRRDPIVNFLQIIAQVIFFFHPLVWLANRLIRAEREKCCDEAAIARLDASPKDYGRAIVDVLVNEYESTMPTPSMAIAGPVKNIENRIKTIMQPGRKFYKRPTVVAIMTIISIAAVTVPISFALSNRPAKDPSSQLDKGTTKIYQVNRTVSDFPEGEDFSTPESAYAAINRVMAAEDYDAWQRVSVKRLAKSLAKDAQRRKKRKEKANPEWSKTVLNARILEVRIKDEQAVVIAEFPQEYTSEPVKKTIDYRHLVFEDGKWLNTGENRYDTIEQAREKFDNTLKKQLRSEQKYSEVLDKPEALMGLAEELFEKIRKADYEKILSYYDEQTGKWKRDGWKKLISEKHYMTYTNFPGMVKWICENFKKNPIVSVELGDVSIIGKKLSWTDKKTWPAIHYKLTLKDGAVLEGDLLFKYTTVKGKGYWEAMLGLDWHLMKDPFAKAKSPPVTAGEFGRDFAEKVGQFDIDNADLDTIIDTFGQPLDYIWGQEKIDRDNLPIRYIAVYPNGFRVFVSRGKVVEIRFEHDSPGDYLFLGKLKIGSSLDEVFEVLGQPEETVEGKEIGWEKNVLYKDIDGSKGYCYYHRPDKNVRIFFTHYKILALYMTRSDYADGSVRKKAEIPPTSTINEEGHIVDKVDYPFVTDPEVIGGWKSVDFVGEIDSFDPAKKNWQGELYLNHLIFKEGGSVAGNILTWTKGLVLSDDTASKYIIREIDGSTYMFFEWKSGDYTIRHSKPSYYVLKKVLAESLKYEPMMGKKAEIPPTSTINEQGHIVDKVDYPFVNDPKVIGTWKAIDYVDEIERFKVDEKQWKGRGGELFLHEMIFEKNGRLISKNGNMPRGYPGDWTKGLIIYDNDTKTASRYTLKDMDGAAYMFREWKSGDYTFRYSKPSYYVLKKVSSETGKGGDVGAFGGIKQPWEKIFNQLYRLEDDQVLKRIAPPFIPERKDYYYARHASQAKRIPEPPDYFIFHWDGELKNWGLGSGGGASSLNNVLNASLSIPDDQFEGPEKLLKLPVGGDWIVRKNVSDAEKLRALEKILLEELGEKISFQKRKVAREVIIAKGKFKFSRPSGTYDDRRVHFYSDKLDPRVTGVGKADTVADLINVLGQRTGLQVIDETRSSSKKINLPYGHHRSSRLSFVNTQAKNSTKLKMMLKNLEKQTNLKFTVEERTVSKWIVTGDGYENSTAVIGSYGGGMGGFGGVDPKNPLSFQPGHDPTEGKTQIAIETRFLLVDENFLEDIAMHLPNNPDGDSNKKKNSEFLDDVQVDFILRATQMHKESKTLTAPRLTVYDNEPSNISVLKERPYVESYTEVESAPNKPEAKLVYFEKGVKMDITPHVTEDKKSIRVELEAELSDMFLGPEYLYKGKHPYHKPEISRTIFTLAAIVPDGKTMLIGPKPYTDYKEDGTKVKQNILILLKATIIKNTTPQANLTPSIRGSYGGASF